MIDQLKDQQTKLQSSNKMNNSNKVSNELHGGQEFLVELDRSRGDRLGISLDQKGMHLVVKGITPDGVLSRWNTANPLSAVQPGHLIISVNGQRGDAEKM